MSNNSYWIGYTLFHFNNSRASRDRNRDKEKLDELINSFTYPSEIIPGEIIQGYIDATIESAEENQRYANLAAKEFGGDSGAE